MGKEWWELMDDESRIMSLYRRFDAITHLSEDLLYDGDGRLRRSDNIESIIAEVGTIIPETSFDFIAQSVLSAYAGKIDLT
jgi:hypothetical protein